MREKGQKCDVSQLLQDPHVLFCHGGHDLQNKEDGIFLRQIVWVKENYKETKDYGLTINLALHESFDFAPSTMSCA